MRKNKFRKLLLILSCIVYAIIFFAFSAKPAQAGSCASAATGNWATAATWGIGCGTGGSAQVPVAGDSVTISNGHTVTYNVTTGVALSSVTVGQGTSGILTFGSNTTARTMNVTGTGGNFTIAAGGTVTGNASSAANHVLNIAGNFTNNGGTFTSTNAGKILTTFNGATTQTISGTGVTFYILTVNNASSITTLGVNTTATTLTLTTGTFDAATYLLTFTTFWEKQPRQPK